jgi:hypothetical protein
MTPRKTKLLRFLEYFFAFGEISIGLGLIAMVPMIHYAAIVVERGYGNLGIYVSGGAPSWSLSSSFPFFAEGRFGNITIGPFGFHINGVDHDYRLIPSNFKAEAVVIDNLKGTVTFKHPEDAISVLAAIKWPFVISMFCTGGISILILEMVRRILRRLRLGQVFTAQNIRTVHLIGCLFIASSLFKLVTTGWLKYRMVAYVVQHVAAGTVHLDTTTRGDWSGITMGLVILALAEVFRQGLLLREENALTI